MLEDWLYGFLSVRKAAQWGETVWSSNQLQKEKLKMTTHKNESWSIKTLFFFIALSLMHMIGKTNCAESKCIFRPFFVKQVINICSFF